MVCHSHFGTDRIREGDCEISWFCYNRAIDLRCGSIGGCELTFIQVIVAASRVCKKREVAKRRRPDLTTMLAIRSNSCGCKDRV
jgi:hypothetical protein